MRRPDDAASLRPVATWLACLYGLVTAMVVVGGVTRLTGSGLSMVEWRPLMGALPPLSEAEWLDVFAKYQQTPQYLQVNTWMSLADFQRIFFWEYVHRLLGRLIGVAFLVPWIVFLIQRRLDRKWAVRTGVAFALGGLQGALGWFMVASGLVDVPAVSHFRLAAHLTLAFFVGQYLLWLVLEIRGGQPVAVSSRLRRATWWIAAVLVLQIIYGAFMAGTKAGWMYSTFPTMHGEWIPSGMMAMPLDVLNNPVTIHFIHRLLAVVVSVMIAAYWCSVRRQVGRSFAVSSLAWLVVAQFGLGVATVLMNVPIALAVLHQLGAFLLLSALVATGHALRSAEVTPPAIR